MYDWNHNGKIDAGDHAFTAFMIDQMEKIIAVSRPVGVAAADRQLRCF